MHTAKGKQMSFLTRDERIVIEFSRGYYFCKKQGDWMQKLTTSLSFLKLYSKPFKYKVILTKQLLSLLVLDWFDVEIKTVFNTENPLSL